MIIMTDKGNPIPSAMYFCCFFTVFSQMPFFVENGFSSLIASVTWLIFSYICIIYNWEIIIPYKIRTPLFLGSFILIFILTASVFNQAYIKSALFRPIFMSLSIMMIGAMCGNTLRVNNLHAFFTVYVITAFVVVINVFIVYFIGQDSSSISYLYGSKNSTSQIALTAVIFVPFLVQNVKTKKTKLFFLIVGIMIFYVLIIMRSRGSLISIPFLIFTFLSERGIKVKKKSFMYFLLVFLAISLIISDTFNNFLINEILFAGHNPSDINQISSGRIDHLQSFLLHFQDRWLVGSGAVYYESLPLAAISSYGLFTGGIVIVLSLWPLHFSRDLPKLYKESIIIKMISIAYVINGVFEELAPFGPGVKNFVLWFMVGVFSTFRFTIPKKTERPIMSTSR